MIANTRFLKRKMIYFVSAGALIISFVLGFLVKDISTRETSLKVASPQDIFRYLGTFGDKNIFASYFMFPEKEKASGLNYALKIDSEVVYWATDYDMDGQIDEIKYLENGKLIYNSSDNDNDGIFERRMIDSYNEDGSHVVTMVDMNADNHFDLRILYKSKEGSIFKDAIAEVYFNGEWVNRVTKDNKRGIVIDDKFYPIKFIDKKWVILEDEAVVSV